MKISHSQVNKGDVLRFRKTMTVADQAMFTGISGNLGGIYVDILKAKALGAENMVVFELAAAGLATTCLARLGGPTRRIAAFQLDYPAIVVVGDSIEASAEVLDVKGDAIRCRILGTRLSDAQTVFQGEATLAPVKSWRDVR